MGGPLIAVARRHERALVSCGVALVVLVLVVAPLVAVVTSRASGAGLGALVLPRAWWLLARSLALSACVTAVALVVGVPLGAIVGRVDVPLRRALWLAHALPMVLPPLLPALGFARLFGADGTLGSEATARLLYGPVGLVLVLGLTLAPIVTSLTALGVSGVDASIEESARQAASPLRVATKILLPLARPAIATGALLVFVLALSEVGVPMFLRVHVYASSVFARLGGAGFAAEQALALSLPLLAVGAALLLVERRVAGARSIALLSAGRARALMPLRRGRGVVFFALALGAALSLAPLASLALATRGPGGGPSALAWAGDAPTNGIVAAAAAATLITALGLFTGHASARRLPGARWIDGACVLAFVTPAAVTGLGLVRLWNRPGAELVYQSLLIVVLGYAARYAVIGARVVACVVADAPASIEEAAAASGARFTRRLLRLVLPMHRRGVVFAWLVALVFCLRDVETVILFYPPGGEPLPVRIFTLEANGPPAAVATLCMLHVVITGAAIGASSAMMKRRGA